MIKPILVILLASLLATPLQAQTKQRMAIMNSDFIPVCVGRFVVDVPRAAEVISKEFKIEGDSLEFTRMGLEKHKQFLVEREKHLRTSPTLEEVSLSG